MLGKLETMYEAAVPQPDELWERAGQHDEVVIKQTKDGRNVIAPVFDVGIKKLSRGDTAMIRRGNKAVGQVVEYEAVLNDGAERKVRVNIGDESEGSLLGTRGTAFATTVDGYAAVGSETVASEIGIPVVQVGAEYSGSRLPCILDSLRVGGTIRDSVGKLALAKSAQAELSIVSAVADEHDLPREIVPHGDSRAGITALGHAAFASMHDLHAAYIDPKALVSHDRIKQQDMYKLVTWLGKEGIIGSAVIAKLGMEGDLLNLRGTASLNLNFLASSFVGTAPALATGEAGRLAGMMPDDTMGFAVLYAGDILCDLDAWQRRFEEFPNIHAHVVQNGVHAHLMSKTASEKQHERFERLHEQNLTYGHDFDRYNMEYITGHSLGDAFTPHLSSTA